jgi:hypothetical protein
MTASAICSMDTFLSDIPTSFPKGEFIQPPLFSKAARSFMVLF